MPSRQYTWEQVMLTLAAIAYRGFELMQSDPRKGTLMYDAMAGCLRELGPVKDQWDIVWGPASFSPFGIGFADTAVYVAQYRRKPSTFAVAVRGTNPVCLFDWLFGDFMVTKQVPWSYGNAAEVAGAQIAFSTTLSLNLLQHLRSQPPQRSLMRRAKEFLTGLLSGSDRGAHGTIESPDALRRLRDDWTRLAGFAPAPDAGALQKWIADLDKRERCLMPGTTRNAWDESSRRLQATELDLPALLTRATEREEAFVAGIDLRSFLAAQALKSQERVDVYVTGHSKGGALSSTLALWLADTQGVENVRDEDRWDPARKTTVRAYSFAAPTAGNAKFARHSDAVIGPRCYRVVNQRDIVPYAWAPRDLRRIPELYSMGPVERDLLRGAVETLIRLFGELDYEQIGNNVANYPGVPRSKLLFAEIVHQHLDGYFEQTGLAEEMRAATFFKPLLF